MVDDLAMSVLHVKVESIRVLAFEVPQQRLAESGRLHHPTHSIALEERVELGDGAVKGLG